MIRIFSALSARHGATRADAARWRNLLALSLATFLASVGFMIVMPLLPGLIRESVGGDGAQVGPWLGLAIGVSPLLTALTGPFWSVLGERFGRKAMIQRSLVCIGIGIGLLALASSPLHVVALRAFIGALGGVSVAALAAVAATTPRRDLGPAVGTLQAAQTGGAMVGPLVGGLLGGLLGMREAFVTSAAVFGCAILLVQHLYRESDAWPADVAAREDGESAVSSRGPNADHLHVKRRREAIDRRVPAMIVVLLVAFVVHFVEGSFIVLLPLQLERLGVATESLPWVFGLGLSAASLAATVAGAAGGRLTRGRSARRLLCVVLALGILTLVPLALAEAWWQFLALRVLMALAVGAAPTLAYSAAAELASPERRAAMVSLVSSAGILGWAASPLVAGALAQVDPSTVLGLDGLLYGVVLAALLASGRGLLQRFRSSRVLPAAGDGPALQANVGALGAGARRAVGRSRLLGHLPRLPLLPRRAQPRFTSAEVWTALRGDLGGPRAEAILDLAARPAAWLPTDPRRAFGDAPRYADRLPTILHWIRQGEDAETIGRRLSLFGSAWAIERTVDTAAGLIARQLNRR